MSWTLGPAHPDYGQAVEYGARPAPRRIWRVGERRPCARSWCQRTFVVAALFPDRKFCSLGCADRARSTAPS